MTAVRRLSVIGFVVLALIPMAVGCSSDTKDKAKDTAESLKEDAKTNATKLRDEASEKADEVKARVAVEELRTRLKANKTADTEGLRSVTAINKSAADVAGSPKFVGVQDSNGDGLDDDGKVQVDVGAASACLVLPQSGQNTSVHGGDC